MVVRAEGKLFEAWGRSKCALPRTQQAGWLETLNARPGLSSFLPREAARSGGYHSAPVPASYSGNTVV